MTVTSPIDPGIRAEERSSPSGSNDPSPDEQTRRRLWGFPGRRWLRVRDLNVERELLIVQWALPLVLTGIVLLYEVTEHFINKGEPFPSPDFLGELFFFGILGPIAVWLVLRWIRQEWHARERDKQTLQQMYSELTEAQASLNTLHTQRGELLNRLMSVQEQERQYLAREIHDELGQLLTGLSLHLKLCQEAVPEHLASARQLLAKANAVLGHTIDQSHRLIADLRPTVLDDCGLVPALQEELQQRLVPLGIDACLDATNDMEHLPPDVATAAFRIVQEAITNVIRHAQARQVRVLLEEIDGGVTVIVEDDGVGLPETFHQLNGHEALGILGMQERARLLGGWLDIEPVEPHGTRVHLWLPIPSRES